MSGTVKVSVDVAVIAELARLTISTIKPAVPGATPLMLGALEHLKEDPALGVQLPKRMGYPDEFAMLVESIVRNPYLNGENIRLDGALRFTAK